MRCTLIYGLIYTLLIFQTDSDDDTTDLLIEMFPGACSVDVKQCLSACKGDVDAAAQLLLQRDEYRQQNEQTKVIIQSAFPLWTRIIFI